MLVVREQGVQAVRGGEVSPIFMRKKIENQKLLIGSDDAALPVGNGD
jgi:hypothetical protein